MPVETNRTDAEGVGPGWTSPHRGYVTPEVEAAARRIAARRTGGAYVDAPTVSDDAWRCEVHAADSALYRTTPALTAPVAVPDDVRRLSEAAAIPEGAPGLVTAEAVHGWTGAQVGWHFTDPAEGLRRVKALAELALAVRALLSAPSATRPEAGEDHQPALIRMLSADHARMRKAGTALAEAALYSVREYDGLHRLSLAVAEWSKAVADEGGRAERFSPPPVSVSAPTEEGMRIFADQQSREFVEACDQAEATALSPDTDTAGREGWQPIETAPKDGRMIGVPGGCAFWQASLERWVSGVGQSCGRPIQWDLTHWKSLDHPSKAEG